MLQNDFLRLVTRFSCQPRQRRTPKGINTTQTLEALESRRLLSVQSVVSSPTPEVDVTPGSDVAFDVLINTTDPVNAKSNSFAFTLNFNSTKLTFKNVSQVLGVDPANPLAGAVSSVVPGDLGPDTGNTDNIAETDTRLPFAWNRNDQTDWPPGDNPVKLFRVVFTAKAEFTVGSTTQIGFNRVNTPTGADGTPVTFTSIPLTVNSVAVPPPVITTTGDSFSVRAGGDLDGNVLTNDSASPATALTAALKTDVTHGELELNPDGSFTYTPTAGFVGIDSFVYTVSAGGATADGTATIVVTDVPDIAGDGNVTVSYVHGNLRVLGDKGNNSIQISGNATSITVLGLGNTKINGATAPYVISSGSISNNLLINMRGGNDTVGIKDLTIQNNTGISLGLGNDILEIDHVTGLNDLRVSGGLGNDRVSITNSTFHDNVKVNGSGGNDLIGLKTVEVGGNLIARGSGGSDVIIADNTEVGRNAVVSGGGGNDALGAKASSVGRNLRLTGGGGKDTAQVDQTSSVGGKRTVNSVAMVSATDSFFEARRHDLFDLLLFS